MLGAEQGGRWSVDAVVQMVVRVAPGVPQPLVLHGRDGTAIVGLDVGVGEHTGLWRALRSEYERSRWWPVLAQDDPPQVCSAPPFVAQSPSQVLAEAVADTDGLFVEMIDAQAWSFGFGDWWTGPDRIPPLSAFAEHLGPVRTRSGRSRFNTEMAAPAPGCTWFRRRAMRYRPCGACPGRPTGSGTEIGGS